MELIIIRHGESFGDINKVHEGRADLELTELGKEQAKKLSKWLLEHEKIDIIVSSPLKRARKTANFIQESFKTELVIDDSLMEWNNGLLAGVDRNEAEIKFPIPKGGRKPHHEHYETESEIHFRARAEMFISKLKENYFESDKICIVSHGGMINMLLKSLLNMPMITENSFTCGDTSINKLKVTDMGCRVHYLNRLNHLEGK